MMREVCLRQAEEENFLQIVQGTSTANSKSRRLVVQRYDETFNVGREVKNRRLRSLMLIRDSNWMVSHLHFTRLKLMRVLDLSLVEFEGGKLHSSIGKLVHLKYLSLKGANVTHLPSSMRNLKQLLYLNLHVVSEFPVYIPNILNEMRELIYLLLPERLHDKVKVEVENLINLETLENFSTGHGRVTDLQGMTLLRTLSITVRGKGCNMETLSSSLSELRHLESLTIRGAKRPDTRGFVLDCVHLKHLKLRIHMPRLLAENHMSSHLTTIHLNNCCLEEDPMPILENLLQLKEVQLCRSFCGRRMVCSKGGFPELHRLQICALDEWEEWIVEEGSMPLLRNLYICDCDKLKELPDGLRFITALKNLSMGVEWRERLSEREQDYFKIKYIPAVEYIESVSS